MQFVYEPLLDTMIELYQKPREIQTRFFDGYLKLVQTPDKKDMQRPIPFFNPMGKEHVLERLQKMKEEGFEHEMEKVCKEISTPGKILKVYFNLADDIAGGRTNRDQTHEMSKNIRPFITRGFCVVVFYMSDEITPELIEERVKLYAELYKNYKE